MKAIILAAAAATTILAASPALATCNGNKCNPEPPQGGDALSQALHAALNNQQAQGQVQGQHQGQGQNQGQIATGGNATGGNAAAGALANAAGGKGGKGGAGGAGGSADATGGAQQQTADASNGGNTLTGGDTNVDASQHNRYPAASAAPAILPGYGMPNCVGDTNPSGQLALSAQAQFLGLAGASMKAHNFCALVAVAGAKAGRAYLAQVDPNARAAMLNNGMAITKQEATRRANR